MHSIKKNEGIIALTKASCPFILNLRTITNGDACLIENQKRLNFLREKYTDLPLFWVARSSAYIHGQSDPDRINNINDTRPFIYFSEYQENVNELLLNEIESELRSTIVQINEFRKIFLVLPTPEMRSDVPKAIMKPLLLNKENNSVSISKKLYYDRNKEMIEIINKMSNIMNVTVLDPISFLCNETSCSGQVNGRPIFYDGDHMSEYGNKLLTPMFRSALNSKPLPEAQRNIQSDDN